MDIIKTKEWLIKMKEIGDDWISPGKSFAPKSDLIDEIIVWLDRLNYDDIIDIEVGLIPIGGIGVVLIMEDNKIYFEYYNDGKINIY